MIERKKIKASTLHGKGAQNYETKIRQDMLDSEAKFKEVYKSLTSEQKKQVDYNQGIAHAKEQADQARAMRFLDDEEVFVKKSSDKPMNLPEFTRFIKSNLNDRLVVIQNNLIGENVGGHSVHFVSNDGLEFICGVGKNMEAMIKPESEFHDVWDGTKKERKIKSRGWLAAVHTIEKWLKKHKQQVYKKDF